jgi:hypothetical protein
VISVQQIADAPLKTVEGAIEDAKAARSLQNACKAHLKRKQASPTSAGPTAKRPAAGTGSASQEQASKRARLSAGDGYMLGPTEVTPAELEASLSLPLNTDEDRIAETALQTNRAPLVLAFAVELLRHTMPEQPPSSRLSLAQAVVSANSRSKAVSLGLDKGPSADEEGWGEGQPRIKVMGREIAVLKRGGYQWKGEEEERAEGAEDTGTTDATPREPDASASTLKAEDDATQATSQEANPNTWTTSPSVSLKQSTFVARATSITDPSQRPKLLKSLFEAQPGLRGASHNVWAYRIHPSEKAISNHPREASHDDGESGAGELLSRILRETSSIDTLVVMTRWYGGVMLGPDRWRLMRNVATQALSERMRRTGIQASLGGEAVWGLDLEGIKSKSRASAAAAGGGMLTHRPEAARNYLLKSFASAPAGGDAAAASAPTAKKKTVRAENAEREENLGLLLGALRLLFDSWADFLSADELDRRAWGWYVAARPDVDPGPSGWGAKGTLRLKTILDLRRKAS